MWSKPSDSNYSPHQQVNRSDLNRYRHKMKKGTPKTITSLNTGIFYGYVHFSCGMSRKQIAKSLKKVDGWREAFETVDSYLFDGQGFASSRKVYNPKTKAEVSYLFMHLREFNFTDDNYCTLAHEVLHLCQFILPDYLDRNVEIECEAYLHTHLMTQALSAMRESITTKNK